MATTLHQIIIAYCLKLINLNTVSYYLNVEYKIILEPILDHLCSALQLVFPPSLLAALTDNSPPPISFFLNLPSPERGTWGIYVVVLLDPEGEYHLYTGSGTNAERGLIARAAHYKNKTHHSLGRLVRQAYDEGCELQHIGMLCWTKIPQPTQVPRARLLFLCLEACFTCLFYTCTYTRLEPLWTSFTPWTRESVTWGPLCSHIPFREGVGQSLNLTPQQLQDLAAARTVRDAKNNKVLWEREREKDLEAALARKRTEKANRRTKNKKEGLHRCDPCDKKYGSAKELSRHLRTEVHAQQLALNAGAVAPAVSKDTLRCRRKTAEAKKSGKFSC